MRGRSHKTGEKICSIFRKRFLWPRHLDVPVSCGVVQRRVLPEPFEVDVGAEFEEDPNDAAVAAVARLKVGAMLVRCSVTKDRCYYFRNIFA
jgi:hypothetical protein